VGKSGEISNIFCNFAAKFEKKRFLSNCLTTIEKLEIRKPHHMNTFIGNIEARLDGKGRVFIPANYRKILAEMGSTHIIMRRDTDNECVIFYPEHIWHAKVSELRNALDEWDPEDQMILMQFMSEAEMLDMDSQGRVLLQKKNLEMIGAQQDILFVGMLDRFAIWNPSVFSEKQMPQKDLAERIRNRMKSQPKL
jgi:MraZ protein